MTAATLTLTEFLLARIAEDEAVAREATPGSWHADDLYSTVTADPFRSARGAYDRDPTNAECWVIGESMDSGVGTHNLHHIARFNPARVLAECEAKRRIVAHLGAIEGVNPPPVDLHIRSALAALALPYRDHPDYRDEWRP